MDAARLLIVVAIMSIADGAHAFSLCTFRSDLRLLAEMVEYYVIDHRVYPVTDEHGTWFEKLEITRFEDEACVSSLSPNKRWPIDFNGNQILYEPPSLANGNRLVIRLVGPNGVDDRGRLDDYDVYRGGNFGYWETAKWPRIYAQTTLAAVLAIVTTVVAIALWRRKVRHIGLLLLFYGLLAVGLVPYGADHWHGSCDLLNDDPPWVRYVVRSGIGLLVIGATLALTLSLPVLIKRHRPGLCPKCGYDLRGTFAAGRTECPECGQQVAPV